MAAESIERIFLGIERPGLQTAAEFLLDRFHDGLTANLRDVLVVVPGRRAGRRLVELLVQTAEQRRLLLTPPVVETVGRVAEHLYVPKRPFANDLTQQLAWAQALRGAGESTLSHLLPVRPPDESPRWLELAELLRRQHIELAADGLNFHRVAAQVEQVGGREERRRWEAMAVLQDSYLSKLDGLQLWDRQTARLTAIEFGECATDRSLIMLGTVDINVALQKMLDQVAQQVTCLLVAPSDWSDRFDRHGALIASCWQDIEIAIAAEQVEVVDRPRDQAAAVVRQLARVAADYHIDEVTIGVPNDNLVGELQRQLQLAGVDSRWGPGKSLRESGPYRLLSKVAELLAHDRFADFAELVRHPDVERWLLAHGLSQPWLTDLDRYQAAHLPYRRPEQWLGRGSGAPLEEVSGRIKCLLAPLLETSRLLGDWRESLSGLLVELYGHRQFDQQQAADRLSFRACRRFLEVLDEQSAVPLELAPRVSAEQAIRMVLNVVGREPLAADPAEAVELLGWLELPLDDAPVLIVTSLNEGFIPESVNSDLFMPNALRAELGLLDNTRRYARDAYALHVLLGSRESLHFIAGRRTQDGDPLLPSRMLFATSPENVARRAKEFFSVASEPEIQESGLGASDTNPGLAVPHPEENVSPPRELPVTSFRDYLACPYRFYLRHVLRLESLDDRRDELDGGAFGVAAHEVLRRFGADSLKDVTDPSAIRQFLYQELDQYAAAHFGGDGMPAVRVQLEQLRLRLAAFSLWQAERAAAGWQIESVESGVTQTVAFVVDDQPVTLRGRIDRIDFHPASGKRMILDYKTSDRVKNPDKSHQHRGLWVDLQLPLYRHFASSSSSAEPPQLGYILLPRDTAQVGLAEANWSPEQLLAADEVAREVIRSIRRQEFWPPVQPPPDFSEDFSPICQDAVLG